MALGSRIRIRAKRRNFVLGEVCLSGSNIRKSTLPQVNPLEEIVKRCKRTTVGLAMVERTNQNAPSRVAPEMRIQKIGLESAIGARTSCNPCRQIRSYDGEVRF